MFFTKIFFSHVDKKTKRLKRFFTTTLTKKPNAWKYFLPPHWQKTQTLEKIFYHHTDKKPKRLKRFSTLHKKLDVCAYVSARGTRPHHFHDNTTCHLFYVITITSDVLFCTCACVLSVCACCARPCSRSRAHFHVKCVSHPHFSPFAQQNLS